MTRSVVTGGAGFIGSNLVDRLLAEGHEVVVIDNLSSGSEANLADARAAAGDRLELIEADICDPGVTAIVSGARPDLVFHLAAQSDVRVSVSDPTRDARINVIGLLNVLEGARTAEARKFLFASSGGTIYGEVDSALLPVSESEPRAPLSPYGVTKSAGTDYLETYRAVHGLDSVSLALANVYGPRQDPHGEAGVVAIFAGRLLGDETCTIFGDGEQTRDYIYVDDVVSAFVAAASQGSGLVNIGTGVETSVNDLFRAMADAVDEGIEPTYAPARAGELDRSALDPTYAAAEIGWVPRVELAEGAARVLAWWRDNHG